MYADLMFVDVFIHIIYYITYVYIILYTIFMSHDIGIQHGYKIGTWPTEC